jgi:hypothetical protein
LLGEKRNLAGQKKPGLELARVNEEKECVLPDGSRGSATVQFH